MKPRGHCLKVRQCRKLAPSQFRNLSNSYTEGNATTTTDDSLDGHSLHEWILLGVRFAFRP